MITKSKPSQQVGAAPPDPCTWDLLEPLLKNFSLRPCFIVVLAYSCSLMKFQGDSSISFKVMKGQNQNFEKVKTKLEQAIRPVFTDLVTNALVIC